MPELTRSIHAKRSGEGDAEALMQLALGCVDARIPFGERRLCELSKIVDELVEAPAI